MTTNEHMWRLTQNQNQNQTPTPPKQTIRKALQTIDSNVFYSPGSKKLKPTPTKRSPFRKEGSFSELTEEELTAYFSGVPFFRFEFCRGLIIYENMSDDLQLLGTIQAAADDGGGGGGGFSLDPLLQHYGFSYVFNREFDNPLHVSACGYHSLDNLLHCSLPLSSTSSLVQILAKLYVTTDKVHEILDDESFDDLNRKVYSLRELAQEFKLKFSCTIGELDNDNDEEYHDNEAFQVCDDHAFIDLSDKPNGGYGNNLIPGRDGSLQLYYAALKYPVDAYLDVRFVLPLTESKVFGRVTAYYGKDFDYDGPLDRYRVVLFESSHFQPGKLNLMRSELAVPAKFSLIIEADLFDNTSVDFLKGTYEFFVPLDGRPSFGRIASKDCSLELEVNWKLPEPFVKAPSPPIYCPPSNSSVSRLTERRKFGGAHSTSTMADHPDQEDNRWSLQKQIEKVFNTSLKRTFGGDHQETVSCSISTCAKEDGGDYICSSVLHIWPQVRKTHLYRGPKFAGLAVKDNIMGSEYKDMMERCVVCGPGFVKFKLSGKWIAKAIHKMLTDGIDTWAPKLSVRRASVYFLSTNIAKEMQMGHLRSTFIGETLARMLEYSRVVVLRKTSIHLDIRSLPLLHPTDFRHTLNEEDVGWIVHVTDADNFKIYITAAKGAGLIANDHSKYPLSHVGFGLVQGDDFERFQAFRTKVVDLVKLLGEAKSRSRALLARQGMADEWTAEELEHAAEALGYGAVKYADLKNNRLTNYTFSFDQILKEEGNTAVYLQFTHVRICSIIRDSSKDINKLKVEELILKNERELGLHLLRFTEVLGEACTILAPHILCEYLYELCKKFNGLRSSVWQVAGSSEETSKLLLCEATEVVMRKCFDLLGITPICKI